MIIFFKVFFLCWKISEQWPQWLSANLLLSPLTLSLLLAVSLPLIFSAPSYSQQPDTWGNTPLQTLSNKHSYAETTSISDLPLGIGSRPMWRHTQLWQYTFSFPYWPHCDCTSWKKALRFHIVFLSKHLVSARVCLSPIPVFFYFSQGKVCFLLSPQWGGGAPLAPVCQWLR